MEIGEEDLDGSFEQRLTQYKVSLARRAITVCNGNKTRAAKTLEGFARVPAPTHP
jgi:hypothetical protein